MERTIKLEAVENLPLSKFCNYCSRDTREHFSNHQPTRPVRQVGQKLHHLHLFNSTPVMQVLVFVPLQPPGETLCTRKPGRQPGFFSDGYLSASPALSAAAQSIRRKTMDQEKSDDQFHDSATEDLYDLYNACNGVIHESLLDISKLDELSAEEIEVLDIDRLREVWHHMASGSGCDRCKAIVNTLNSVREQMRKQAEELDLNSALPGDNRRVDPTSEQAERGKK